MAGADEVNRSLMAWAQKQKAALFALGQARSAKMEAEAKRDAPWKDRTSQARQGLRGGVEDRGDSLIVYLAHTANHGVYLELAMQQRFAVLEPTAKRNAPEFFAEARQVVGGR